MSEPVREAERRLREWSQDDIHLIQSVRMHEPTYRKPSLLRADVRAFLADRDRLAGVNEQLREVADAARDYLVSLDFKYDQDAFKTLQARGDRLRESLAALSDSTEAGK